MSKKYIDIKDEIYRVEKFDDEKKLKKGFAYIRGNLVYPYMGKLDDKKKKKVGVYKDEDDSYRFIKPISRKKAEKYSIEKIYSIEKDTIKKIKEKEGLIARDLDIMLAESDEVFKPPICDSDNVLQRLIKKALDKKEIDIKNYVSRFDNPGDMSNFKRALLHHGKMSVEKFIKWCYVLDLEFTVTIRDKEGAISPMNEEISDS